MEKITYDGMAMVFKNKAPCKHDIAELYNLLMFKEKLKEERKKKKC